MSSPDVELLRDLGTQHVGRGSYEFFGSASNIEDLSDPCLVHPSRAKCPERNVIEDALNSLRVIKRDELGFPDWESEGRE
jgi:hypothetical protein